jgi:hypothetical protein
MTHFKSFFFFYKGGVTNRGVNGTGNFCSYCASTSVFKQYGMQLFKSDRYGRGYGYYFYRHPTVMLTDMILLLSYRYGLSAIFCGLSHILN